MKLSFDDYLLCVWDGFEAIDATYTNVVGL